MNYADTQTGVPAGLIRPHDLLRWPTDDEIRTRAHQIWEEQGKPTAPTTLGWALKSGITREELDWRKAMVALDTESQQQYGCRIGCWGCYHSDGPCGSSGETSSSTYDDMYDGWPSPGGINGCMVGGQGGM